MPLGLGVLATEMQEESAVVRKWAQRAVEASEREKDALRRQLEERDRELRREAAERDQVEEHCEQLHELGEEMQLACAAAASVLWERADLVSAQHVLKECVKEPEQVAAAVGKEVLAALGTGPDRFDVTAVAPDEEGARVRAYVYFWPPTAQSKDVDQSAHALAERLVRAVEGRAAPAAARSLLKAVSARVENLPVPCRASARFYPPPPLLRPPIYSASSFPFSLNLSHLSGHPYPLPLPLHRPFLPPVVTNCVVRVYVCGVWACACARVCRGDQLTIL